MGATTDVILGWGLGGGGGRGKRGEAFQAPLNKLGWHGGQEEVRLK